MAAVCGRRESQKAQVRLRLIDSGVPLFIVHGFDGVTIDDIADAAGVSRRTFFNYFPGKEDVVFAWTEALRGKLVSTALSHPSGNRVRELARACIVELVESLHWDAYPIGKLIFETPTLRSRVLLDAEVWEIDFAHALCRRVTDASPVDCQYVAMAAMGILRIAGGTWVQGGGKGSLKRGVAVGFSRLWPDMPEA